MEGTCYLCGYDSARGDQCDKCGQLLDATLLIDPHSKTGNRALELRSTEHQFLDLAKLAPQVAGMIEVFENAGADDQAAMLGHDGSRTPW